MQLGYARVSTSDQKIDLQLDALDASGCDTVFRDEGVSAVSPARPGFNAALSALNAGDTLVTWRLDRAFRSTVEAILTIQQLSKRGVAFRCTAMPVDLSTPEGRKWFRDCASQAEYEREVISARTRAGMAAAKARGARIGRPRAIAPHTLERARSMMAKRMGSVEQIASKLRVARSTLYRELKAVPAKD